MVSVIWLLDGATNDGRDVWHRNGFHYCGQLAFAKNTGKESIHDFDRAHSWQCEKDPVWQEKLKDATFDLLVLDQREAQKAVAVNSARRG